MLKKFAAKKFNDKNKDDIRVSDLTRQMRDAFYRREHETVEYLAKSGARFVDEMLITATNHGDSGLIALCLDNGLRPDDDLLKSVIAQRDVRLFKAVTAKTESFSPALMKHIEAYATEAICEAVSAQSAQAQTKVPPREFNTALLSTP